MLQYVDGEVSTLKRIKWHILVNAFDSLGDKYTNHFKDIWLNTLIKINFEEILQKKDNVWFADDQNIQIIKNFDGPTAIRLYFELDD